FVGDLDDRAQYGADLERSLLLEVLKHRGLMVPDLLGARESAFERNAHPHAERGGDALRLAHHRYGQAPRRREAANLCHRHPRQSADRIEGAVSPCLQPQLAADVLEQRRLEPPGRELRGKGLSSCGDYPIELAQRKAGPFYMTHDAGLDDLGCRVCDAADNSSGIDRSCNHAARIDAFEHASSMRTGQLLEVPPGNTVLHG